MHSHLYTLPQSSEYLPCTLISLEDWKLIKIEGKDAIQYLQGQLTCDLKNIHINQYTFSAHCNPRGKMISSMYVFHLNSGIALIERNNICNKQIAEMKKYAIFSKIQIINDDNFSLYGVAGLHARIKLKKFFKELPNKKNNLVQNNGILILHFNLPKERFLLIIPNQKKNIAKKLKKEMETNNSLQWTALDIESGYPIINIQTTEKIIPQSANIDLLNGINFHKGCYIGQEIIARIQYKNINKKSLYWLIGDTHAKHLPQPGNHLEIKIQEKWKPTGLILESCKINTGEIWIQAILQKSISHNTQLRTVEEKIKLKIRNLPYSN